MCDPSQFRATYSTNAETSSLYHSAGRMVLEEVLLLENKLLQASLLSTFFPLVRFSLFSRLSCLEYSQYCQNAFFCSLLLRLSQKLTIISQICYSFYDTERLCYRQQTNTAYNFANEKPFTSNAVFGEMARGVRCT